VADLDLSSGRVRRMNGNALCDLEHQRAAKAVVHVLVKSTRVGRAGHPMVRDLRLCVGHARQLRDLGVELISR